MLQKNILLVSDESYLRHGEILIKSLFLNTNKFKIHYFLITNKKKINLDSVFYNQNVNIYLKKKIGKNKKELRAYYANSRIDFCKELFFYKGIKHLMYIDVDSIVRKDISKLYTSFLKSKKILQIKKRDTTEIKNKFMTGIFLLKKNKKFINLWIKNLNKMKFKWFGDQISIYETSKNKELSKLIIDLPHTYIDFKLDNKSFIWSGRSGTKNFYKYKTELILVKKFYKNPRLKNNIDNFFLKKILYIIFDYYDKKFTKKFSFLFHQEK